MIKYIIILFCLIIGFTGIVSAHDEYYKKHYHRYSSEKEREEKHIARLEECVGSIKSINGISMFELIAKIDSSGFITKHYDFYANDWALRKIEINKIRDLANLATVVFSQVYKGIPVYKSSVNLELTQVDEDSSWTFLSLGFYVADINTTRPVCIRREEALKIGEKYLKENYVPVETPGLFNSKPSSPILDLAWSFHEDIQDWSLSYITRHSYYLDTEDGIPKVIGLELDAVTGKVLCEIPRSIDGCFGPASKLKKPKK